MTSEHLHNWTNYTPWTQTNFDTWMRERDCTTCGEVENELTHNAVYAGLVVEGEGYIPPEGPESEVSRQAPLEGFSKAAYQIPEPEPDPEVDNNRMNTSLGKPITEPSDSLTNAYLKAIETVRLLKMAIDERDAQKAKLADLLDSLRGG